MSLGSRDWQAALDASQHSAMAEVSLRVVDSDSLARSTVAEDNQQVSPKFEAIAVTCSSDVHIGDRTVYNGPITINHYGSTLDLVQSVKNKECGALDTNTDHRKLHTAVRINSLTVQTTSLKSCAKTSVDHLAREWLQDVTISKRCMLGTVASIVSVAVLLGLLLVLVVHRSDVPKQTFVQTSDLQDIPLETCQNRVVSQYPRENESGMLKEIQRDEWHARSVGPGLEKLLNSVEFVIISHTATKSCFSFTECVCLVHRIQTHHIKHRCWDDIGYNFLVGGDGYVYIGRGWHYKPSHSTGNVKSSISINFIGLFSRTTPTKKQILASKQLIQEGVDLNKIVKDYTLLGLRQVVNSESPGDVLFEEIKSWPHWINETLIKPTTEPVEPKCR